MSLLAITADVYTRSQQYLEAGPGHFFMYTFGRFRAVRSFMVWRYRHKTAQAAPLAGAVAPATSLASTVDVAEAVRQLERDGVSTGLNLRQEIVEQLLSFAMVATCYGDGDSQLPFNYGDKESSRRFQLGRYNHALRSSPTLQGIANDPQLLAIARKYLRTEPVLVGARMWWSLPTAADQRQKMEAGQGFHYDIDGYRGLTFFFYLTDVGPTNGPHVYVRGTHRRKTLKHLVNIHKAQSDEEVEARYGAERQIRLCGPAGSGFAEDIFGFHKGLHPEQDRLIVQVRFGLRDYGTGHAE